MTTPHYPMPEGRSGPPPAARPGPVTTAFVLLLVSAALSLAGLAINTVTYATVGLPGSDVATAGLSPDQAALAESITRVSLIVGAVLFLAFETFLLVATFKMRAGRNWARIVLTVVGGLGVALTIVTLALLPALQPGIDLPSVILGIVQSGVIVAAIVLMFRPAANLYFRGAATSPRNG
ncbi:hypothetical protein [Pseudonocardia sp. TRM90224]|uniref:hypothetical protein n=1 Tax=Pseudonocardia sp. TRM90224 TaxID=2812678 RepID=UPI001E2D600E|nr:hypothetical protein [Pseudonocardia sp. TRM90224]